MITQRIRNKIKMRAMKKRMMRSCKFYIGGVLILTILIFLTDIPYSNSFFYHEINADTKTLTVTEEIIQKEIDVAILTAEDKRIVENIILKLIFDDKEDLDQIDISTIQVAYEEKVIVLESLTIIEDGLSIQISRQKLLNIVGFGSHILDVYGESKNGWIHFHGDILVDFIDYQGLEINRVQSSMDALEADEIIYQEKLDSLRREIEALPGGTQKEELLERMQKMQEKLERIIAKSKEEMIINEELNQVEQDINDVEGIQPELPEPQMPEPKSPSPEVPIPEAPETQNPNIEIPEPLIPEPETPRPEIQEFENIGDKVSETGQPDIIIESSDANIEEINSITTIEN